MEDFFGEVAVIDAEDKKFGDKSVGAGFNLVTPKFLVWSKDSKAGNKCPQVVFVGKPYENDKEEGFELPDGTKAKGPSLTANAGKWKSKSEWDNPTKEMVMEFGSNLIAIFQRMSVDTDKKYREAIKGINPLTDFNKFFEVSKRFLESKPMMPVWIKVSRTQREDKPEFFNYDICSNLVDKDKQQYQFIVVNPSTVKTVNKNKELDLIDELSYTNEEGEIKKLTWKVTNKYDNKMLDRLEQSMDPNNIGEIPPVGADDLPF